MYPKVSVIILNWNGWKDTIECLESLYNLNYPNYDIILVDNASEDNSIENIEKYCKGEILVKSNFFKYNKDNKPIKIINSKSETTFKRKIDDLSSNECLILIQNDINYGFAEGNNIGIRFALNFLNPEYILLLNNDTVVDTEFLKDMVVTGDNNNEIGIMGPTVYWYNNENIIQSAGVHVSLKTGKQNILGRNKLSLMQSKEVVDADYVSGCALLIKSTLINKIGLLDHSYFLYWEETDWCFRALKHGSRVCCVTNAKIWHKESTSTNKVLFYFFTRNTFLFMKKHALKSQYITFLIYFFGFRFWFMIAYILYNENMHSVICFFKGVKKGLFIQNQR